MKRQRRKQPRNYQRNAIVHVILFHTWVEEETIFGFNFPRSCDNPGENVNDKHQVCHMVLLDQTVRKEF